MRLKAHELIILKPLDVYAGLGQLDKWTKMIELGVSGLGWEVTDKQREEARRMHVAMG